MNINFYELDSLSDADRQRILRRAESDITDVLSVATTLVHEVRDEGDTAISRHLADIDKVDLPPDGLKVTEAEFDAADELVSSEVRAAVLHAIRNVTKFHRSQLPPEITWHEVEPGVMAGEKVSAIDSVGLYVPRGKGAFPSVMIMLGAPAKVAGVPQIAVATPPNPDGSVDAASLVAAREIGVTDIYKVGGASAVAAFACGTQSIPNVVKILGPGNQYCAAAKRLLADQVDVGLPAGPSESIIFADDSVSADLVATDLCIEAEHGPDSAALLVTHSRKLAEAVRDKLPSLVESLPSPRREFCTAGFSIYGGIMLTSSLDASADFINQHAPEHLELLVEKPFEALALLRNVGEVLIGPHTPISVGNYCLGVNAILPTGAYARTHSCTSTFSFLKRTSLAHCTAAGYEALRETTAVLAEYEGFPAHARAVTNRPNPG